MMERTHRLNADERDGYGLNGDHSIRADLRPLVVHVYCGNSTKWRGFFEDPEECNQEQTVMVHPEERDIAAYTCAGCGIVNTIRDHEVSP